MLYFAFASKRCRIPLSDRSAIRYDMKVCTIRSPCMDCLALTVCPQGKRPDLLQGDLASGILGADELELELTGGHAYECCCRDLKIQEFRTWK